MGLLGGMLYQWCDAVACCACFCCPVCSCSDAHASVLVPLMLRAFDSNSTRAQEETLKALQVRCCSCTFA